MATGTPLGAEIVERIAEREGVDPVDLDDLLYDAIDAEALDALTDGVDDRQGQNLRVEFTYHGYAITVDGTRSVTIDEQTRPAETEETSPGRAVDD